MEIYFLLSDRVSVNEAWSEISSLGELAISTPKAAAAQQQALDLLANTVLDNYMALAYLLAEQGGICVHGHPLLCIDKFLWRSGNPITYD